MSKNRYSKKKKPNKKAQPDLTKLSVFKLNFKVIAPIITAGYGSLSFGLDKQVLRDHNNKQVLPGSLIKGNLRHAFSELQLLCRDAAGQLPEDFPWTEQWLKQWFGAEAIDANPQRGKLHFDFNWQHALQEDPVILNRIAITESGTTEKGSLAFIESAFKPGTEVTFSGCVRCYASEPELKTLKDGLKKALSFIDALGSLKSVGFGAVVEACLQDAESMPTEDKDTSGSLHRSATRYPFTLTFDRPVCFPLKSSVGNRFETQHLVPGAALKGALAASPNLPAKLLRFLDKVQFSYVYPEESKGERLLPLKRSLVQLDGESFQDVALKPLDTDSDNYVAFQDDWKDEVFEHFPYAPLDKTIVVRTAINPLEWDDETQEQQTSAHNVNTGKPTVNPIYGTAKTGQLFSYVCINHEQSNTSEPVRWQGYIDVCRVPENFRKAVLQELLTVLSQPIFPLGKTRAIALLQFTQPVGVQSAPPLQNGQKVVVTLNSPAWLHLRDSEDIMPTEDLTGHYKQQFLALSQDSLDLHELYAHQYLSGGEYMHFRFFPGQQYKPQVLTSAGSVFVFTVADAERATLHLNNWLNQGLAPLPGQWGSDEQGDETWSLNPFNRGNGYGEISVEVADDE